MKEAATKAQEGVVVGGLKIPAVRFADDQAMLSNSENGLQKLMDEVNDTAIAYGMRINIKKTKIMKIGRKRGNVEVGLNGELLEQVTDFKYLGSILHEEGRCTKEIKTRIAMAKCTFNSRRGLLTMGLSLNLRKRMVKSLV